MPITQSKKQSAAFAKSYGEPRSQSERDIEKRLKLLRQQVYGKSEDKREVRNVRVEKEVGGENQKNQVIPFQYHTSHPSTMLGTGIPHRTSIHSASIHSDTIYLRHDLLKITSFAALAFAVQIFLFFLLRNILKLPIGN